MKTVATLSPVVVARSKVVPPSLRGGWVARAELVEQLRASQASLVAISGPAGSGKSTLMAQCHAAHAAQDKPAWLSLDKCDNDPVVLWSGLLQSLRIAHPTLGEGCLRRLLEHGSAAVADMPLAITDELAEHTQRVRLFIDDLHLIDDPRCLQSLDRAVGQLSGTAGVVVASRRAAPLPLARLQHEGRLLEIGGPQLALSIEEAAALFRDCGASIEHDRAAALVEQTEGWAAGLQFAAMALGSASDVDSLLATFGGGHRVVADYLIAEVLDLLRPVELRFLMETALLRRLSGELCDAVTDRIGSVDRLASLAEANVFVLPLDSSGGWYRYHRLFAELLRERFEAIHPNKARNFHSRAFAWFRDHGDIDEAFHHGLAAGRRVEAADLLCRHWLEHISTGRHEALQTMIGEFEPTEIAGYQPLAVAAASIYGLAGDRQRAITYLRAAGQASYDGPPPDGAATIESSLALMRGSLAFGGIEQARIDGLAAYELEPPGSRWRALAALIVGLALVLQDETETAQRYFEEAKDSDDTAISTRALAEISLGRAASGLVDEAMEIADRACQCVHDAGLDGLIPAASASAAAAVAAAAQGDTERAHFELRAAARPLEAVCDALPMDAVRVQLVLADVALTLDDQDSARYYANRVMSLTSTLPGPWPRG